MSADLHHERDVELRWPDLDAFGHVNNAVYLTLFETARLELMLELLDGSVPTLRRFVVRRVEIDYLDQVTEHDKFVRVGVTIDGVGRTSVRTSETMHSTRDGRQVAALRAVVVFCDATYSQPEPVPEVLRARVEAG